MSFFLDVGIVNYNGGNALVRCVRSLNAQKLEVRVWVYDNASTDGSILLLQKEELPCRVIQGEKNLGYAGACNELMACFEAPFQALCNMDLEFPEDWSFNISSCFERYPEYGAVASLVMERSGKVNALGVLLGKDLFAENEASGKDMSCADVREKDVFGCYGAVMAFRKMAAQKVGPMDASFFLFFEESEWFMRFNLCGFKTVLCPSAKVFHERSMVTVRYSPMKLYYSERNRLRSAIRLLPVSLLLELPFRSFARYLKMAKGGVPTKSGDGKKLSKFCIIEALAKAWFEAALSFPREWKIRRAYAKRYQDVPRKITKLLNRYPL